MLLVHWDVLLKLDLFLDVLNLVEDSCDKFMEGITTQHAHFWDELDSKGDADRFLELFKICI
eukprot:1682531-Amphidinium_carterae.1